MAPVNFEKDIREKLQSRELQPNPDTWNKLSGQLGEDVPKKNTAKFIWLAVAASFIGILLISTFLFGKGNVINEEQIAEENDTENLVDIDKKTDAIEDINNHEKIISLSNPENENKTTIKKEKVSTPSSKKGTATDDKNVAPLKKEGQNEIKEISNTASSQALIAKSDNNKENNLEVSNKNIREEQLIDSKVNEVITSIKNIQNKNKSVTLEEIDALLAKAQKDIAAQRILSQGKVDAMALLEDVEFELQDTFRERVFMALEEGFDCDTNFSSKQE